MDEGRSAGQLDPGHTLSESSDDSCGDTASQDTSCATASTTTNNNSTTTTRISSDDARLGRDVDSGRHHVTAMTSRDYEDEHDDEDSVYVGNHHGNKAAAAAAGGWTDLCRSQTMLRGLSPMSTGAAAVTIGHAVLAPVI